MNPSDQPTPQTPLLGSIKLKSPLPPTPDLYIGGPAPSTEQPQPTEADRECARMIGDKCDIAGDLDDGPYFDYLLCEQYISTHTRRAVEEATRWRDERIDWLEKQRSEECSQKLAALSESEMCLRERDQLRADLSRAHEGLDERDKLRADCGAKDAEIARLNGIITGIFPETAALHEILARSGCVSVRKDAYETLRYENAKLREAFPVNGLIPIWAQEAGYEIVHQKAETSGKDAARIIIRRYNAALATKEQSL